MQVHFEPESLEIRPAVKDREEYARAVADIVVREAKVKRQVDIQDLGGDVSSDGGITFNEIQKAWGEVGAQLLSSTQSSTNSKYANRVTQYWMGVRDLIATGHVTGFNINSRYAKDLFERRYLSEQTSFKVEKKKDMKKRIGRSPDNGDAVAYTSHLVMQSGMINSETASDHNFSVTDGERVKRYYRAFDRREKEEEDDEELLFVNSGFDLD